MRGYELCSRLALWFMCIQASARTRVSLLSQTGYIALYLNELLGKAAAWYDFLDYVRISIFLSALLLALMVDVISVHIRSVKKLIKLALTYKARNLSV